MTTELTQEQRKQILHAIHAVQDADAVLLGHAGDQVSEAMRLHRIATKALLQALGMWKGQP
jgi:hypothetical protein